MAMTLMTAIIIANNTNLIYTHAGPVNLQIYGMDNNG